MNADFSDAEFGSAPSYSTRRTLTLALLSVLAALLHGGLGAVDYPLSRPAGLAMMLVAGGLLVYGILLGIRYAEAQDAMHDPLPRSALYDTAHERGSYATGLLLHAALLLTAVTWAALRQAVPWHALAALLSAGAIRLLLRGRPAASTPN